MSIILIIYTSMISHEASPAGQRLPLCDARRWLRAWQGSPALPAVWTWLSSSLRARWRAGRGKRLVRLWKRDWKSRFNYPDLRTSYFLAPKWDKSPDVYRLYDIIYVLHIAVSLHQTSNSGFQTSSGSASWSRRIVPKCLSSTRRCWSQGCGLPPAAGPRVAGCGAGLVPCPGYVPVYVKEMTEWVVNPWNQDFLC